MYKLLGVVLFLGFNWAGQEAGGLSVDYDGGLPEALSSNWLFSAVSAQGRENS